MPLNKAMLEERRKKASELDIEINSLRRQAESLGDISITTPSIDFRFTTSGDLCYRQNSAEEWRTIPPNSVEKLLATLAPFFGYAIKASSASDPTIKRT